MTRHFVVVLSFIYEVKSSVKLKYSATDTIFREWIKQHNDLKYNIAMAIIMIAGLLLRFYRLDFQSLDFDETASWLLAKMPISWNFISACASDNTPPMYQLLLHGWLNFFPDSEFSMRLLPLFLGLLSLWAIYRLGTVAYNRVVGIYASLFLAFSFHGIFLSQYSRSSSLFLLLSICTTEFWIKITRNGSRNDGLIFAAISIMSCYTHYFGLVFLLAQYIIGNATRYIKGRPLGHFQLYFAISALAYLPWLFKFVLPRLFTQEEFWAPEPSIRETLRILGYPFDSYLLIAFSGILLATSLWRSLKKHLFAETDGILVAVVVAFFVIVFAKSSLTTSVFLARYFIPFLPLAMVGIARLMDCSISDNTARWVVIMFISIVMLDHLTTKRHFNERTEGLETLVLQLDDYTIPGRMIFATGMLNGHLDYHLRKLRKHPRVQYLPQDSLDQKTRSEIRETCLETHECGAVLLGYQNAHFGQVINEADMLFKAKEVKQYFDGEWNRPVLVRYHGYIGAHRRPLRPQERPH